MTTSPPAPTRGILRWLSPWFSAYALAGLLVNGMVPVMLPVTVGPAGPVAVAAVVSSFFAGQLTAPLTGSLADRRGWQRPLFLASFPVMAIAAVAIGVGGSIVVWIPAVFIAGAAAGAAQTLGSVFIVEGHPKSEWDTRIGWFRLTFGIGQVGGLAIGAVFADGDLTTGWLVAAGAILVGVLLGRVGLPRVHRAAASPPARNAAPISSAPTQSTVASPPARNAASTPAAPPRASRRARLSAQLRSPFGVFLLSWLLAMIAVQTILNVLPLVMRDAFGMASSTTASVYLVGSIAGAALYPVAGALAKRTTPARVLAIGLGITLVAFVFMAVAFLADPSWRAAAGVIGILLLAIGYPFDYIGATMLAAFLAEDGEGAAMGLFNSAVAAGAIVGAIVPAAVAGAWGYGPFLAISAVVMVAAILVGSPVLFRRHSRAAHGTPSAP